MPKFVLVFLLVYFGGLVASLVSNPVFSFSVYQLIYFLNPEVRWWVTYIPSISYSFFTAIFMLVLFAARYPYYARRSPWFKVRAQVWLLLLLGCYYMVTTVAINSDLHWLYTTYFTKQLIIVFLAYKLVDTVRDFDIVIWGFLVGCAYIGYVAFSSGRSGGGRLEGIGMVDAFDSNDTAAALAPAMVLILYFLWRGNRTAKVFSVIFGALIANALVLINSRGAFVGVSVSVLLFLNAMLFSKYKIKGQKAAAIFIVVAGVTAGLAITDDVFWERMGTIFKQDTEDTAVSGVRRVNYWYAAIDMVKDRPLGLGVYGFNLLSPVYISQELRGSQMYRSVHSMYFQGLSEVGWLGFFIFTMMLLSLRKSVKKTRKHLLKKNDLHTYYKVLALEYSFIAFLVAGVFINRFRAETLYWHMLFLMLAVKFYLLNDETPEEQQPGARKR